MSHAPVKIGVRGSRLGLSIGQETAEALRPHVGHAAIEFVPIPDPPRRANPAWPGAALERALLHGEVDAVIQNAKDLSPAPPAGIQLAAVTQRFTPFDVLIALEEQILDELPDGAALSAHTPLRRAQLLHYRGDLRIVDFAGSLDERIRMLERGDVDGLVVSAAAVEHLGLQDRVTEIFTTAVLVPAPGQGMTAVQVRAGSRDLLKAAKHLDDATARAEFDTERAFLRELKADFSAPVGALASNEGGALRLEGVIVDREGRRLFRDVETGAPGDEEQIGARLAQRLLAEGARSALAPSGGR
ncbi:MAG TPA: hydroxymethylbilane synthase [Candidatus Eisenbacteria bacterium]